MSFLDKLSALMPFGKKEEILEYFFALNISSEKLTAALWTIDGRELKILGTESENYSSLDDMPSITDKLLDSILGIRDINVQKILFGVPSTWLSDENLKEEYLKILKNLVKELELTPMAYVESSNALIHLLEKQDSIPPTAVLVGFEKKHLVVIVVRAGKLDGVKIISRGDNSGADIEKALSTFTAVETLPSKILIYGLDTDELKNQLLSFPWMSKLSFLHFPKIDNLDSDIEIKSVCLAGASEIKENILYTDHKINESIKKSGVIAVDEEDEAVSPQADEPKDDFGFVIGDVAATKSTEKEDELESEEKMDQDLVSNIESVPIETNVAEIDDFEKSMEVPIETQELKSSLNKFLLNKFLVLILSIFKIRKSKGLISLITIVGILAVLIAAFLFLPKANVKIFVEPKILEKDSQVTADPSQKVVNEDSKIIPGQIVQVEVSGTDKDSATGKKMVGDSAKGTVVIYNKTSESKNLSKGAVLSTSNGIRYVLDSSVNIASQSASDSGITFGKSNGTITASNIGADGNLPSGSELSVANFSPSLVSAKAEGNFSGGNSKDVTVVSSDDTQRLLAKLSSNLRQQAQQKLQDQYKTKKILQEALSENIIKKSYNKNINDQASELSLNLTVSYKGTAFDDSDLRSIVSTLVTTQVPDGFLLDLSDTETQADVSKLEKDGKLIFLAKFKAKLLPKIDTNQVREKIKGKSLKEANSIIKSMDNVLGSEIVFSPKLPTFLQRLPLLEKNIKVDVGLK